ncbi:MAG: DUF1488 family protein [Steroidobacteraceae bacterium]
MKRADDSYDPSDRFSGVDFPMADGKSRIIYRVSYEALQDRASADGTGAAFDAVETFLKHRGRIEQIASDKYDAGNPERVVTTAELTPLPRTPAVPIPPGTVPEAGTAPTSTVKVVSDSGLPFGTSTEIFAGVQPQVNRAALSSTTGEVLPPLPLVAAALSGEGKVTAEATVMPGPGPIERRLSERPTDIRDAARALSRDFTAQVEELKRNKPNDADRLAQYDVLIPFFERMAVGLGDLADVLDRAGRTNGTPEPVLLGKAAEVARQLQLSAMEWLEANRTMVIDVPVRLGLFGLGVAFLHALGVDSTAVTASLAYLAGLRSAPRKA